MIVLTNAEDSRPMDVCPREIAVVCSLDATTTEVTLRSGLQLLVKETRAKVRHKMKVATEFQPWDVRPGREVEG